jgi:dehydrogenase/reductase SDR family protein 1
MVAPMKGQVCVVTGASRGIGRGIALQLCQAGATVYITGRHLETLRATAEEVSGQLRKPFQLSTSNLLT